MFPALPLVAALLSLAQVANPPSAIVGIPPAPSWTANDWNLIIGGIGLQISICIAAYFTGLKALQLVRHSVKQNDDLAAVTTKIETNVNSEKTAAQGREAALRKEIDLLREMIAELKRTADLYAQASATNTALLAQPTVPPPRGARASDPKTEPNPQP